MLRFIAEPIQLVGVGASARIGEPGLPSAFRWREQLHRVQSVLDSYKTSSTGQRGVEQGYVRKHWFRIRTDSDQIMVIYFERQSRTNPRTRWWLYGIEEA